MSEDKDMSELFKKYAAFIPKGYHEATAQLQQKKLERDYWKAEAEKWKQVTKERRRKWARKHGLPTETALGNLEKVWRDMGGQVGNFDEMETAKNSGRGSGSGGGAAAGSARGISDEPGPSGSQGKVCGAGFRKPREN